jgi:hypothetical protein
MAIPAELVSPMKVGAGTGHDGRLVLAHPLRGAAFRRIRPLLHSTCQRLMGITGIVAVRARAGWVCPRA